MYKRTFALSVALACAGLTMVGCSDRQQSQPLAPSAPPVSSDAVGSAATPGEPGAASDRLLFQVRLRSEANSQAVGVMLFEVVGGYFTARVQAAGLEPLQRIPQHIHVNPTCNPGGGILLNLDQNLTVAGEGPGVGAAYPLANAGGVVKYESRRPLTDLITAVNVHFPAADVQTVDDLLAFLDLENRNAHMHVAFGPPFPAVNCGEIERIN
jgi:hypothetical protein